MDVDFNVKHAIWTVSEYFFDQECCLCSCVPIKHFELISVMLRAEINTLREQVTNVDRELQRASQVITECSKFAFQ